MTHVFSYSQQQTEFKSALNVLKSSCILKLFFLCSLDLYVLFVCGCINGWRAFYAQNNCYLYMCSYLFFSLKIS